MAILMINLIFLLVVHAQDRRIQFNELFLHTVFAQLVRNLPFIQMTSKLPPITAIALNYRWRMMTEDCIGLR
ncbi:hypothetical protein C8R42DRAFT_688838 [Lentinula raphanica]|nr:hypothetical protein C8R42DRAFT_688838 [Lentinula raphanica]